jgi:hypothetical protein
MGRFAPANRLDRVGTWLSLVEHSLGVRGVGSSNLPVPTIFKMNSLPRIFKYSIVSDRNSQFSYYGGNQRDL